MLDSTLINILGRKQLWLVKRLKDLTDDIDPISFSYCLFNMAESMLYDGVSAGIIDNKYVDAIREVARKQAEMVRDEVGAKENARLPINDVVKEFLKNYYEDESDEDFDFSNN